MSDARRREFEAELRARVEAQEQKRQRENEARAAIGRVLPCRPHGRASISNFIYRALDLNVSTGIVMGAALMTIPVDTFKSSAL
jgi:hypothetical protein